MPITVTGAALSGVDAIPIEVEVDLLRRLPAVTIVGLAASAVKESAERVRSALNSAGEDFPRMRVVVNLMPADVRKEGTALDLPVALGILAAAGRIPQERTSEILAAGELSLSGELRPTRGALSMALLARKLGRTLILPAQSAQVAAVVPGVRVVAARHLTEVIEWLRTGGELPPSEVPLPPAPESDLDLSEVRGQPLARKALEVAAAGAHHLLLTGPPGCGKSMLARRLPGILPPMTFSEALETTQVHCAAGLLGGPGILAARPFRAPHHTVSVPGLVGDARLRPGEVSLAHNGVLFLDEAPEFPRRCLEVLRQPLEDGIIHVRRAAGSAHYPAGLTLVMAANPCACGHHGSTSPCLCTEHEVLRYRRRLSGPILDRVDLRVHLQAVSPLALLTEPPGESSFDVRTRVIRAREQQAHRGQTVPNARLTPAELERVSMPTATATETLHGAASKLQLSGRALHRLVKVARTLADLDQVAQIDRAHITDALLFRAAPRCA